MRREISIPFSQRKQDWAYQQLRDWILAGVLRPGELLSQETLAADLGISRVPLRHALARLAGEGLVVDRPHQRWLVAAMSVADAHDVYHGRAALEAMLGATAARVVAEADPPVDLSGVRSLLEEYGETGDGSIDRRFHQAIYALAGMPSSLSALEQLRSKSDRYVALYLADVDRAHTSLREHEAIFAAIEAGDAERAAGLIRDHVLSGLAFLTELLTRTETPQETTQRKVEV